MISKLYIRAGGGLGDVVRCYLKDNKMWGYLEDIKRRFPACQIKLFSTTHNPQTLEFFKHHPHIDSMHEFGWNINGDQPTIQKHKGAYVPIEQAIKPYIRTLKWRQPIYYLSDQDLQEVQNIRNSKDKLVVMHPFALRKAMPIEEFVYMTDKLIDSYGYHVVYLGGNHNRFHNVTGELNWRPGVDMIEECDYQRDGLFNLLNTSNIRVAYKLIELCDAFIGHCSCFNITAWIHQKRSVVFSPAHQREILTTMKTYAWPLIDKSPWVRNYYDDEWHSTRKTADETIEFIAQR